MIGEDFSMNTEVLCKNNKVPSEKCHQVKCKHEITKNRKYVTPDYMWAQSRADPVLPIRDDMVKEEHAIQTNLITYTSFHARTIPSDS